MAPSVTTECEHCGETFEEEHNLFDVAKSRAIDAVEDHISRSHSGESESIVEGEDYDITF